MTTTPITIRHTHQNGTILEGSSKGDGVYEIVRQRGFTWRPRPGIFIRGSRDKDAQTSKINAAAEALRAAGWEVTVDIDDAWRPAAEREADRAERAEDRADRHADRAGRLAVKSAESREAALDAVAGIPFGQPILVGHHSERRHRRDLDRHESGMRRSFEEADKARELARRAEGVRSNEEAKHNPRAVMRRIDRLEAERGQLARMLERNPYAKGESVSDTEWRERVQRALEKVADDIAHQQAKLDAARARREFVPWGPEHFRPGDEVYAVAGWMPVRRVNAKSLSVPGGFGMAGMDSSWNDRVTWDDVHGRRRDGMQLDRPDGEEWPAELAKKVERWTKLRRLLTLAPSYEKEQQRRRRHVEWALRLALGLELTASEPEVAAYPEPEDVDERRAFHARCVDVFDRLNAGEQVNDIRASLTPADLEPAWRFPHGEPKDVRADEIQPGDVVKGIWDYGFGNRRLITSFAGPVESVEHKPAHLERSARTVIRLTGGEERELRFPAWLAAYRAGAEAGGQDEQQLTLVDLPN